MASRCCSGVNSSKLRLAWCRMLAATAWATDVPDWAGAEVIDLIARHMTRDWGDGSDDHDAGRNQQAMREG